MKTFISALTFGRSMQAKWTWVPFARIGYAIIIWSILQLNSFSQTGLTIKKDNPPKIFHHSENLVPHEFFQNYIRFKSIPGNKEKSYLSFLSVNTSNNGKNNSFKKSNSYTMMLSHGSIYDDPMFNNFKYPDFKMSEDNNLDPLEEALLEILSIGASGLSIWYYDKNYVK